MQIKFFLPVFLDSLIFLKKLRSLSGFRSLFGSLLPVLVISSDSITVQCVYSDCAMYYIFEFIILPCMNKLPNTRAFMAAEKWMVRRTGVGGLISLQNGNLRC